MKGISISRGSSEARIDLHGAHVASLSLDGEEVVKESEDGAPTHGGIAVLLPFAGRVKRGRYVFDGRAFELPLSPEGDAIHGFAKDAVWEVRKRSTASLTLACLLRHEGYPGVLEARVSYVLLRRSFSTVCEVRNVGRVASPLVVGFHPYLLAGDWRIEVEGKAYRYDLEDRYFPTGERREYSFEGAGPSTPLDDCFEVSGDVRLVGGGRTLLLSRRAMPYLVVYDGKYAEGRSVAVEPYTGLPDAFNNGIGLARLRAGGRFECGYGIGLSRPS